VVIFLPTFALTSKSYQQFGEKLSKTYRVFIPNLGRGKSSGKLLNSLSEYASLLNNFVTKIKINKFYLIGISFGGLIAVEYYQKFPSKIKGLFLTSTILVPIRSIFGLLTAYLRLFFHNLFIKNGFKINLTWLEDGLNFFISHPGQFLMDCFIAFRNFEEGVKELKIPNILIVGDKDEFIHGRTIEEMKEIKGLNLKIIKANHGWLFLRPEEFLSEVENFLAKN